MVAAQAVNAVLLGKLEAVVLPLEEPTEEEEKEDKKEPKPAVEPSTAGSKVLDLMTKENNKARNVNARIKRMYMLKAV